MSVSDEIESLERQLLDPVQRADTGFVERVLAADFAEIGQSGRLHDRQTVMAHLRDDPGFTGSRTLADFVVREIGLGVVLALYRIAETGTLRSSVWRKAAGDWEMVFSQGTRPSD